ncbi:MAG TPA: hypothetical protein VGI60_13700 [Chthoniobacterales bacterium]|jgi:hypothetical protein
MPVAKSTNADYSEITVQIGQMVTSANFRDDVPMDGRIIARDANEVKRHKNELLP